MKKTTIAFAFIALISACNSNPETNTNTATAPSISADTTYTKDSSLSDNGQEINMKGVNDTIVTADGQYVKVQPKTPATTKPETKVVQTTKPIRRRTRTNTATSTRTVYTNNENETGTTEAPVQKKKGWSNAAKGTVIGAGTGAVAGAIISKKKGKGAVIGGLLGAGGGYIIGKSKDKKQEKKQ